MRSDLINWTFVYVIAADLACKIGISRDPNKRLAALQTATFLDLELVVGIQAPTRQLAEWIEAGAHKILGDHRIRGEWFDFDPIKAGIAICVSAETIYHELGFEDEQLYEFLEQSDVRPALAALLGKLP